MPESSITWQSIIFGGIGGVLTSLAIATLLDPKKERIRNYNVRLDNFLKLLESAHLETIAYWASETRQQTTEHKLITLRTACYDQIYDINDACPTVFQLVAISGELRKYFAVVTGGTFQSDAFERDGNKIDQANEALSALRTSVNASRISIKPKTILLEQVN